MKLGSGFEIRGRAVFEIVEPDGSRHVVAEGDNVVTEVGDALVADQMSDRGSSAVGWMAIGSSTGGGTGSTTLDSETARVALDSTTQGTGGSDNDVVYVATFGTGVGTGTVSECGLLNAATAGVLFDYLDDSDFSPFSKGADQSLVVTLTVTFGAS